MDQSLTRQHQRFPPWLRISYRGGATRSRVRQLLHELNLHTVCESANCPNLSECWERGTATFMILGDACTRDCRFCAIPYTEHPAPPDTGEPDSLVTAAKRMGLQYVVVTSVTRDDLPDGGAEHFAKTIQTVHTKLPNSAIEVLTPDFNGDFGNVQKVLNHSPTVFNHNLETCRRLAPQVRPQADYERSLAILDYASRHSTQRTAVKSGVMLGMGETGEEIHQMMSDLRAGGVEILTLGQYLSPTNEHWPVHRYVTPDEFAEWKRIGEAHYGFLYVVSGPLVRSSYHADKAAESTGKLLMNTPSI